MTDIFICPALRRSSLSLWPWLLQYFFIFFYHFIVLIHWLNIKYYTMAKQMLMTVGCGWCLSHFPAILAGTVYPTPPTYSLKTNFVRWEITFASLQFRLRLLALCFIVFGVLRHALYTDYLLRCCIYSAVLLSHLNSFFRKVYILQ